LRNKNNFNTLFNFGVYLAQIGEIKEAEKVAGKLKLHINEFLETRKSTIYLDIYVMEVIKDN